MKKPGKHRSKRAKISFDKIKHTGQKQMGKESVSIEGMRLNKYVAHCGICSRRKAAEFVKEGLVKVNGDVVLEPFYQVQKDDQITFKDELIKPEERKVYILLNKPKNTITTSNDERDRKTVLDLLGGKIKERVYPVGRLDWATTGLLLITNDGDIAKKLSHPSHKVTKYYEVTLDKPVAQEHVNQIRAGITLDDGPVEVDSVNYLSEQIKEEVGVELHVGRNRIVRRIFEHFGYEVLRLDRTYYAGLTKKDLPRSRWRFLSEREIIMLKHFT